jgi:hypothetical protein
VPANTQRQIIGRYGALKSWSTTVDRTARTRPAREKSPSSVRWHRDRLPEQFDNATDAQRLEAAEAAKKAYYAELEMKSAAARRRGGEAA